MEIGAKDTLSPGRARQGSPADCCLGGGVRHMGHHHKRRWKPLLAHQVCGGIRWYLLLGSSKNSPLVPPGGVCENVNPHRGESTCPGRKGGAD